MSACSGGSPDLRASKGSRARRATAGRREHAASRWSVVFLFSFAVIFSGVNLFWTSHEAHRSAAAQRAEQQRYERGQRADQQRTRQASLKAAIPLCMALQKVAAVRGTHGTSSATYGQHLEAALGQLYRSSQCQKILVPARTPHH